MAETKTKDKKMISRFMLESKWPLARPGANEYDQFVGQRLTQEPVTVNWKPATFVGNTGFEPVTPTLSR